MLLKHSPLLRDSYYDKNDIEGLNYEDRVIQMKFSRPIVDVIKQRSSWRSYTNQPIEPGKLAQLREFMASLSTGPFGGQARFELIECPLLDPTITRKLGTYGIVKGARYFLVGVKTPSPMDLEDFGYLFEEIILLATDLGLGTVWLGGTFKRSEFARQVHVGGNETIPAISPVGYVTNKRRWLDSFMRWSIKANTRKPWEDLFFLESFGTPLSRETAGTYSVPLEMVRLAPSARNGQPWRVVKEQDANNFHFFIQGSRKGNAGQPLPGFTRIDCGIAMCHFALTAQELGLGGHWIVKQPLVSPLPPNTKYVATWIHT